MMWKFTGQSWINMRLVYFKRIWLLCTGCVWQTLITKPSAMLCTICVDSLNITISLLMVNQFQVLCSRPWVCFNWSLKFDKHVSDITHKANYQLLCLKHTFSKFNLCSLISLHVSTVCPILEYCSSVCNPLNKRNRERVEKVQCRATKLVPYLRHLPDQQRRRRLQLPSLQFWRDRDDLINTIRVVRNIDNTTQLTSSLLQNTVVPVNTNTKYTHNVHRKH
jgi:hypothetical protein